MLKQSASYVLASFRGSTYRSVRLASSLAAPLWGQGASWRAMGWADEKSGLFEYPARHILFGNWITLGTRNKDEHTAAYQ
jgi:hypothetical protein